MQGNDHGKHELRPRLLHELELSTLVMTLWVGLQPSQSGMRYALQVASNTSALFLHTTNLVIQQLWGVSRMA